MKRRKSPRSASTPSWRLTQARETIANQIREGIPFEDGILVQADQKPYAVVISYDRYASLVGLPDNRAQGNDSDNMILEAPDDVKKAQAILDKMDVLYEQMARLVAALDHTTAQWVRNRHEIQVLKARIETLV